MSSLWASRLARPAFRTDSALAGGSLFPIDPLWGVVGDVPTRWKTTVSPLPTLVLLDLVTKPRDPLWPYLSSVRPGWARDCEFTSTAWKETAAARGGEGPGFESAPLVLTARCPQSLCTPLSPPVEGKRHSTSLAGLSYLEMGDLRCLVRCRA